MVRVGIIGLGGVAGIHLEGFAAAGAEIAAICDVDSKRLAERAAAFPDARPSTSLDELLEDETLDAVSVCTPNAFHGPATLAALAAGKHVYCEKPVSLSLVEGEAMVSAARSAGLLLQVGHHLRCNPFAEKARELIQAGAIGRVCFVWLRQAHDWGGGSVRGAFGSKAVSGGGTLLDNGCHLMDLARFLGGDVQDVFARVATLGHPVEVEDTTLVSLAFESGALGSVENAWTATGWEEAFRVFGTRGSLRYTNRSQTLELLHEHRGGGSESWPEPDSTRYRFARPNAHAEATRRFVRAVQARKDGLDDVRVPCTGSDGLEAVRLVLAAYRSAETGRAVRPQELAGQPAD
ncbi:MAG TPA: Gfo/Idh/MocA family oxidoreductase [Deinococcales bacterium]|nr:Gfo/Idh/MocA family oxidoreductase [Deinococcales bacterium]